MKRLIVNGCTLEMTSRACPEQYDVYFGDFQLGYLRLRHGFFRADYLECGGYTAYSAYPKGDGLFEEEERFSFLKEAVEALINYHNEVVLDSCYDDDD